MSERKSLVSRKHAGAHQHVQLAPAVPQDNPLRQVFHLLHAVAELNSIDLRASWRLTSFRTSAFSLACCACAESCALLRSPSALAGAAESASRSWPLKLIAPSACCWLSSSLRWPCSSMQALNAMYFQQAWVLVGAESKSFYVAQ